MIHKFTINEDYCLGNGIDFDKAVQVITDFTAYNLIDTHHHPAVGRCFTFSIDFVTNHDDYALAE